MKKRLLENIIITLTVFTAILAIFILQANLASIPAHAEAKWKNPFDDLNVEIPGLKSLASEHPMDCVIDSNGDPISCKMTWIAVYIAAIYKYAISAVGILAAVVMMIGGVIWITSGGNSSRVGEARSWILASVAGLVLALLSHTVLSYLNPSLTRFESPQINIVPGEEPETGGAEISLNPGTLTSGTPATKDEAGALLDSDNLAFSTNGTCGKFNARYTMQEYAANGQATACDPNCNCVKSTPIDSALFNALDMLDDRYRITVTSITSGKHVTNSTHYKGKGMDICPTDRRDWIDVVRALNDRGLVAFCDTNGHVRPCSEATHIHFNTK